MRTATPPSRSGRATGPSPAALLRKEQVATSAACPVGASLELGERAPLRTRGPIGVLVGQQRFRSTDLQHPVRVVLPVRCQTQRYAGREPGGARAQTRA